MEDKKGMGMCREGCGCHGAYGDHWMSRGEHGIVRGFLYFFLLIFVFWIGLALGEMRAYLRSQDDYGYRMRPGSMMQGGYWDNQGYPTMMERYGATPQSSPSSPKK